jgi:hypothetical protein
MMRWLFATVFSAMLLSGLVPLTVAQAGVGNPGVGLGSGSDGNPGVLPPNSHPHGASYGEWSARWWQWALSFRVDADPFFDTAGCDAGQSGPVWFLAGSFVNSTVVRDCTVPAGKAILFPPLCTECSTVEGPPFFGSNEAELRTCAALNMDPAEAMFATIDGVALNRYRVQSPLYEFSSPDGGVFGGPVTGLSVSDGVWLMLAPLSAGRHTLRYGGTFAGNPPFTLDLTYNLTVERGRRGHGHEDSEDSEPTAVVQKTWSLVKDLYRR